jgi:dUTP pyrophosphatase
MKVKIKKLVENAVIPAYSKPGDAGMDLTATEVEYTNEYISYKTGLSFEIPKGYVGLLFPRSSNCKKDLILCNSVGILDSGFRGQVEFRYKYVGITPLYASMQHDNIYFVGERIGQIIIIPYPTIEFEEVQELSETERGNGGFGSTN